MIDLNELKLVAENHPVLLSEQEDFNFENPQCDPIELAQRLHQCMVRSDGLGLSACQVGLPIKVFVIRTEEDKPFALFNPKIISESENLISMKEGCLSFPLLYMNVKRPDFVRLRYQNEKGETNTERFIGMTARVVLHEFDHMNGVLFLEKVSRMEKDRSLRKRAILKRKVKKIAKK
jgi:peptide deformylase